MEGRHDFIQKGIMEELFAMRELFCALIVVVVTWIYCLL